MFLLSESGTLLNFQGMKKWLDSNLDENMQVQVCLVSTGHRMTPLNLQNILTSVSECRIRFMHRWYRSTIGHQHYVHARIKATERGNAHEQFLQTIAYYSPKL